MDQWTIAAVILMILFFLVLPVLLGVLVYRAVQKSKKRGIYFLVGVLLLSAIMPAYAMYLGTILLITFEVSLRRAKNKQTQHKRTKEGAAMTEQALDRLARRVVLDAARLEYGGLLEEAPEHTFSPAFERKMKKLLRRGKHPVWYKTLHAAACLLLALLLSGCAVLAVSPEAREAFSGWVREVYENAFVYRFYGEEQGEPNADTAYRLTWLPEGYREAERPDLAGMGNVLYRDDADGLVVLAYATDPEAFSLSVYLEHAAVRKAQVHGRPADLYLDEQEGNRNLIVWTEEETGQFFYVSGPQGEDELVKMAESVEKVEKTAVYRPSWVPEGYFQVSAMDQDGYGVLSYRNGEKGMLTISYEHDFEAGVLALFNGEEGEDASSVFVGEYPADLYLDRADGSANNLVWIDEDRGVFFWVAGTPDGEELIRVGESLESFPEPPPLEARSLTWVPAGYRELERVEMQEQSHVQYQNDEGYVITLSYVRGSEAVHPHVIASNGGELTLQPVRVDGLPGDLYLEEGEANVLAWAQDGLLFSIQGYCTAEELIAMAESVEVLPVEYRLTWVPEGYELYMQNETFSHLVSFVYKTPEGNMLSLTYQPDLEGAKMYLIPDEDGTEKQVSVKGNPADLYLAEPGGSNSELVWQDPEAGAIFIIDASLPGEDILKMAESIEAVRPLPKVRQPNWLPMGYRYAGGFAGGSRLESQYENRNGDEIQFAFLGPHEAEKQQELRETVEGLESQSVLVNGQAAELYSATDDILYLVWNGREPGEVFWLSAALDAETLIEVAESVFYPS